MLKIKDNVDLKELEKYGFINDIKGTRFSNNVKYWYSEVNSIYDCLVVLENRQLRCGANSFYNTMETLYDLIKADLVEKVDE